LERLRISLADKDPLNSPGDDTGLKFECFINVGLPAALAGNLRWENSATELLSLLFVDLIHVTKSLGNVGISPNITRTRQTL
jgi:hypothetical protein